jgi:uncharacterized membrane protein YkvA (DUF1232 family)
MFDTVMERLNSLWLSLRLSWSLMQDGRVPMWAKAIPVLAALYIFSPIDILPDFLLALGQIDDILILSMGLELFARLVPAEIVEEHRQKLLDK